MRSPELVELPVSAVERPIFVRDLEDARDHDLVRRVRARDEEAFRTLFRRYGPIAKGVANRLLRQPFIAEEIVQEAFTALWRNPESYREDRGSFRAWLLSTVHHRAVDAIRREETQRRRASEARPEADVADIGEDVADEMDLADSRLRVRHALDHLPPEQRTVLELMYYEGKTQTTVARELDLPLGTVKSRTLLGMRKLRAVLVESVA